MKIILLALLLLIPSTASAQQSLFDFKDKGDFILAGMCATWQHQGTRLSGIPNKENSELYKETSLFLVNYWTAWADKIGLSLNEAVNMCDDVLQSYKRLNINQNAINKKSI